MSRCISTASSSIWLEHDEELFMLRIPAPVTIPMRLTGILTCRANLNASMEGRPGHKDNSHRHRDEECDAQKAEPRLGQYARLRRLSGLGRIKEKWLGSGDVECSKVVSDTQHRTRISFSRFISTSQSSDLKYQRPIFPRHILIKANGTSSAYFRLNHMRIWSTTQ